MTEKSYEIMKNVGECSTACGYGNKTTETTTCTINLSDTKGLDELDCSKKTYETEPCKLKDCPEKYKFGNWSKWGHCDKTCRKGLQDRSYQIRTRTCTPSNCPHEQTIEKRECRNIDICLQDCPDIERLDIRPQSNQSIEFVAIFRMARVEFMPYGQLDRQELHLEIIKNNDLVLPSTPNTITITNDDFEIEGNTVQRVINNLHPGVGRQVVSYKPIIKVFATVNFSDNENSHSKISSIMHTCKGEVCYIFN